MYPAFVEDGFLQADDVNSRAECYEDTLLNSHQTNIISAIARPTIIFSERMSILQIQNVQFFFTKLGKNIKECIDHKFSLNI